MNMTNQVTFTLDATEENQSKIASIISVINGTASSAPAAKVETEEAPSKKPPAKKAPAKTEAKTEEAPAKTEAGVTLAQVKAATKSAKATHGAPKAKTKKKVKVA